MSKPDRVKSAYLVRASYASAVSVIRRTQPAVATLWIGTLESQAALTGAPPSSRASASIAPRCDDGVTTVFTRCSHF